MKIKKAPQEKKSITGTTQAKTRKKIKKVDFPTVREKTEEEKQQKEEYDKANDERYYCRNANLLREMLAWKNSTTQGYKVFKMVKGKLIPTKQGVNGDYQHERFQKSYKYFIQYPKNDPRFEEVKKRKDWEKGVQVGKKYVLENVTKIVEHYGYAFDIDDNEEHRTISEALGMMMIQIAEKVSNHSFFRNYNQWDKSEMQSYAYEKIIKGLPNYSFKFTNVFAYFTQACFNSFKSILSKHYKQINIKREMAKKAMVELQSDLPGSSMEKCLGNQFAGNDYDDFSEF